MTTLWSNSIYRETAVLVLGFLFLLSLLMFVNRNRFSYFMAGWASVKSWIFVAPIIFIVFALPSPWPLVFLTFIAIFSAKTYFQMVGMYHRSWFVWCTYGFIFGLGYLVSNEDLELYNLSPMLFLGAICMIPLLRNSATHMIQYLALSLMSFIFWGWSFMHMGLLLVMDGGVLMVIYLFLLSEVSDNVSLAASKMFGRIKPFDRISSRVTVEGILVSILVSLLLAWGMRHLLPDRSEKFWIAAGLISSIFGRFGGLIMSAFRRDLNVKSSAVFIIGRGDILSRVDKLIFIGPLYYYAYLYLQQAAVLP